MSFINILHQGITKYDRPTTIRTSEICGNNGIECPGCEMVLNMKFPGQYTCPFCGEIFMAV